MNKKKLYLFIIIIVFQLLLTVNYVGATYTGNFYWYWDNSATTDPANPSNVYISGDSGMSFQPISDGGYSVKSSKWVGDRYQNSNGRWQRKVEVVYNKFVTGVSISKSTTSLKIGETETISSSIAYKQPSFTYYGDVYTETSLPDDTGVTWSSSNNSVATVNSSGTITAIYPGTATITVKTSDGGYTASCAVTVKLSDPVITANSGGLDWSTAGRGWVTLSWNAITGATGYKLYVFDGNVYRPFDLGNVTSWDSRIAKIFPTENTLNGYSDNSQAGDLFNHNGTGLDLRDNPNKLYKKTVLNGYDYDSATNYWFQIVAYNATEETGIWAGNNTYTPTLPNRTDNTSPTGSISINNNATSTNNSNVNLAVSATSSAVAMKLSNDSNFTNARWETYTQLQSGWKGIWYSGDSNGYKTMNENASILDSNVYDTINFTNYTPGGIGTYYNSYIKGYITPSYNQAYTLYVTADDGVKVWVDGTLVIDKWLDQGATTYAWTSSVPWNVGQKYEVVIQHYQGIGAERLALEWSSASQTRQIIPKSSVATTAGNWSLLSGDGTKTVYIKYRDDVGNVSTTYNDSIILDITAPTISVTGNPTVYQNTDVTLTVTATDSGSGIPTTNAYSFDNGITWQSGNTKTYSINTNGIIIKVKDNVGNIANTTIDITKIIKTTPNVSFTPNGNSTYAKSQSTTINVSAGSNIAEAKYIWDNSSTFPTNWTGTSFTPTNTTSASVDATQSTGTGDYYLHVYVIDAAGNESRINSNVFKLDNTAPPTPTANPVGSTSNTNKSITLSDSELGVTIRYTTNGTTPTAASTIYSSPITISATTTIKAIAYDVAGNASGVMTETYSIVKTAPTVSFAPNGNSTYAQNQLTKANVSSLSNIAEAKYIWDNSSTFPTGWTGTDFTPTNTILASVDATQSTGTGDYYLHVYVRDAAGNESKINSNVFKLDNTAPTGSVSINDGDVETGSKIVKLTLSASDSLSGVNTMIISNDFNFVAGSGLNGANPEWEPYSTTKNNWVLGSNNTVYVKFKDNAGNKPDDPFRDSIQALPTLNKPTITGNINLAQDGTLSATGTNISQAAYRIFYTTLATVPAINDNVTPGVGWIDSGISANMDVNSITSVSKTIAGATFNNISGTYITFKVSVSSGTSTWINRYTDAVSVTSDGVSGIGYVGYNQIVTKPGITAAISSPDTIAEQYGTYTQQQRNIITTNNTITNGDYVTYRLEFDTLNLTNLNDIGMTFDFNYFNKQQIEIQPISMNLVKVSDAGVETILNSNLSFTKQTGKNIYTALFGTNNINSIKSNGLGRYAIKISGKLVINSEGTGTNVLIRNTSQIKVYEQNKTPYIIDTDRIGRKGYIENNVWDVNIEYR